jgi:uncharacterized NAD(P)/FAD-binding protein YdhS
LIIGNGLTMVDTVLSLVENGFRNEILSISPHGYNLLPHRNSGLVYEKLLEEAKPEMSLYDWVVLFNKHRKMIRGLGMSAEALVDSLRSLSGEIWRGFDPEEKLCFLGRLRHLWGVARHRIPIQVFDKITAFRIQDTLKVVAGKVVRLNDLGDIVEVAFYDKSTKTVRWMDVGRVINCTGPETDIEKGNSVFLKRCLELGLIRQDFLKLGIEAEWKTLRVIDAAGAVHENMYALGNLLRGVNWETTAVKELREQAFTTATGILEKKF